MDLRRGYDAAAPAVRGGRPPEQSVPFARTEISVEAQLAAQHVLASGWVTTGPETELFEQEFAAYVGAAHAVGVSSCTAALELSLRALRLPPRSRVLVPTLTFCGTAHAVLHAGLLPVLVDVDPRSGMPSPSAVARAAAQCGRPAAMVVVHLAGAPAPLAELAEAAALPLDLVVEDAAHALGTYVDGRPVGALSRASCFSFYATKNLPIGEGGMVTTEDSELAARVRRARLHGMSGDAWRRYQPGAPWRYTVEEDGLKANMTDLQAAVGRGQLAHLPEWQRRREAVAATYGARLRNVPGLRLPLAPDRGRHAWHLYAVRVLEREFGHDRDSLVALLAARGIGTSVHFLPLHRMPWFRRQALLPPDGFPGADALYPGLLSLPLYPGLTERQVDTVCRALAELAGRGPAAGGPG